nr:hypothetical protein [Candidatus Freyrarchaeum guaymaensis]
MGGAAQASRESMLLKKQMPVQLAPTPPGATLDSSVWEDFHVALPRTMEKRFKTWRGRRKLC